MINYLKTVLLLLLFLVSCKDGGKSNEVLVVNQTPAIVVDDLPMEMPGAIFLTTKSIIINNPLSTEKFYTVIDRNSYENVCQFGVKGKSNVEFMFPGLVLNSDNKATLYDMNYNRYVEYELTDFQIIGNGGGDINPALLTLYSTCSINEDLFVGINYLKAGNIIYLCDKKDTIATFCPPLVEGEFRDYLHNMGLLYFDKTDSVLHYLSGHLPYCAKYKFSNGGFKLLSSEQYAKFDYVVKENRLRSNHKSLIQGAFTKDYIVTTGNMPGEELYDANKMTAVGDFNKLPCCLYLYDKELSLKKIINTGIPILGNVVSDGNSNEIYLKCYVDAVFKLATMKL